MAPSPATGARGRAAQVASPQAAEAAAGTAAVAVAATAPAGAPAAAARAPASSYRPRRTQSSLPAPTVTGRQPSSRVRRLRRPRQLRHRRRHHSRRQPLPRRRRSTTSRSATPSPRERARSSRRSSRNYFPRPGGRKRGDCRLPSLDHVVGQLRGRSKAGLPSVRLRLRGLLRSGLRTSVREERHVRQRRGGRARSARQRFPAHQVRDDVDGRQRCRVPARPQNCVSHIKSDGGGFGCSAPGTEAFATAQSGLNKLRSGVSTPSRLGGPTKSPLDDVYASIAMNMAPGGTLLVTGYPHLFSPRKGDYPRQPLLPNLLLNPRQRPQLANACVLAFAKDLLPIRIKYEDAQWINGLVDQGDDLISAAVQRANLPSRHADPPPRWCSWHVRADFATHGLCSGRSWFNGVQLAGHIAQADQLSPQLAGAGGYATAVGRKLPAGA